MTRSTMGPTMGRPARLGAGESGGGGIKEWPGIQRTLFHISPPPPDWGEIEADPTENVCSPPPHCVCICKSNGASISCHLGPSQNHYFGGDFMHFLALRFTLEIGGGGGGVSVPFSSLDTHGLTGHEWTGTLLHWHSSPPPPPDHATELKDPQTVSNTWQGMAMVGLPLRLPFGPCRLLFRMLPRFNRGFRVRISKVQ